MQIMPSSSPFILARIKPRKLECVKMYSYNRECIWMGEGGFCICSLRAVSITIGLLLIFMICKIVSIGTHKFIRHLKSSLAFVDLPLRFSDKNAPFFHNQVFFRCFALENEIIFISHSSVHSECVAHKFSTSFTLTFPDSKFSCDFHTYIFEGIKINSRKKTHPQVLVYVQHFTLSSPKEVS